MLNTVFLQTWSGRFKIAEWVLILIMVLILRFTLGSLALPGVDAAMITYGTIVGYIIIVSAIIANYLLGANISYLELIINGLGIILFTAVGGVNLDFYSKISGSSSTGPLAIGVLSVLTAAVFLADLVLVVRSTEFRRN